MTGLIRSAPERTQSRNARMEPVVVDGARFGPWPMVSLGVLLCCAVAIGGGGVRHGIANLIIQLIALVILGLRSAAVTDFWRNAPTILKILVVLTIAIPATQLIPLPESVWTSLPGRDLVQQSFALTGRSGWAPASVDPVRTAVALTGLIVPLAVLMAGWSIRRSQLIILGWIVVGLGLANFLLGIPQVLSGGASAVLYQAPSSTEVLYGTFANRNSTGLFLVASLCLAVTLPSPRDHPAVLIARLSICALLAIAILLTRSRTALVLAAIPLVLAAFRLFAHYRWTGAFHTLRPVRAGLIFMGSAALAIGAVSTILVIAPGRVSDTMERFQTQGDARSYIWEDSAYSVSRYWPAGAGMGTFDEVFQTDESLENATERRAGRAHNDYLEIAIEAGLPGLITVALWLIMIGWFAWRARSGELRWAAWAGAAILLAIAAQSVTDYPLRNQAMLAIGSFALLLVTRIASPEPEDTQ